MLPIIIPIREHKRCTYPEEAPNTVRQAPSLLRRRHQQTQSKAQQWWYLIRGFTAV